MKIRILKNEDIKDYAGLGEMITYMGGRYGYYSPYRCWFVAFEGNEWAGFGGYREIDEEKVFFGPTLVKEKFRGRGLQDRLINRRIAKAKKDGYKEAYSYFSTLNIRHGYKSGNNLIRAGFEMCQVPRYAEFEVDEVWVKKVIK